MSSVLTIGDHRGRDAAFFKQKLGCYTVASDLNATTLQLVKINGWVDDVAAIDVEKIDFLSESFDFVIGKECFHHFPRPMLGLYEMLRVAKHGVILLEPNDTSTSLGSYIDSDSYHDSYEEVGNYVYRISLREMIKAAWSLYLPFVVAIGFNDPYKDGIKFEEWMREKDHLDSMIDSNLRAPNLMTIAILKNPMHDLSGLNERYRVYKRPLSIFES